MIEERPPVAVGHLVLRVQDVPRSTAFFRALGLRPVFERENMAILELRGGTHLLLFPAKRKPAATKIRNFDLMVDDVADYRRTLEERGIEVSEIRDDRFGGHRSFEVRDPDGRALAIYSSHVDGRPV